MVFRYPLCICKIEVFNFANSMSPLSLLHFELFPEESTSLEITRFSPFQKYVFCFVEWEDAEEGKEVTQQWEDDWDDDDVNDDFSLQLKTELENNVQKT